MIQIFVEAGASMSTSTSLGWNPLHAAVHRGSPWIFLPFLDVFSPDISGRTPLQFALAKSAGKSDQLRNKEIIELLSTEEKPL